MKQFDMFGGSGENKLDETYTAKVNSPIYKPKNKKPHLLELFDKTKSERLISEIRSSKVSEEEKSFLIEAAKRHTIFNYSKIADYYAHSDRDIQYLMEKSALIIIDFNSAIEYGFVKLSEEVRDQYLTDSEEDEE